MFWELVDEKVKQSKIEKTTTTTTKQRQKRRKFGVLSSCLCFSLNGCVFFLLIVQPFARISVHCFVLSFLFFGGWGLLFYSYNLSTLVYGSNFFE